MKTGAEAGPADRPPYDPELVAVLDAMLPNGAVSMTLDAIEGARSRSALPDMEEMLSGRTVSHRTVAVARAGAPDLILSVLSSTAAPVSATVPAVYYMHSGGMILGHRLMGLDSCLRWIEELGVTVVSVEYRLAPEDPYPAALNDCRDGYLWMHAHARELGIDTTRTVVAGKSAGAGLAAGLALQLRDDGHPAPIGQLLCYPMLDDRDASASCRQFEGAVVWDRQSNRVGWEAYLGDRRGSAEVPVYAAPGRAEDLSGLPPAYIEAGSAEVFRDEDVAYASGLWAAGVQAELHVWPGAFHSFDSFAPHAELSRAAENDRVAWLRRTVGPTLP
ncbi:alpha/beta hydrolase [Streptomyces sp. NPDC097610]|uniref:alpha/beta hydrolase n=1 Tax=Streptomyces sp. NPDC097610 TaxID=3157227 RepID=UPI003326057A